MGPDFSLIIILVIRYYSLGGQLDDNMKKVLQEKIQLYSNRVQQLSSTFQQQTQQLSQELRALEQNNNTKLTDDKNSHDR